MSQRKRGTCGCWILNNRLYISLRDVQILLAFGRTSKLLYSTLARDSCLMQICSLTTHIPTANKAILRQERMMLLQLPASGCLSLKAANQEAACQSKQRFAERT